MKPGVDFPGGGTNSSFGENRENYEADLTETTLEVLEVCESVSTNSASQLCQPLLARTCQLATGSIRLDKTSPIPLREQLLEV